MKLRNYLYLNEKIIEDYIAVIDGYSFNEESQTIAKSSENSIGGKINTAIASGGGTSIGKQEEEVRRVVKYSEVAKFEKIYSYLKTSNEENGLKYYEALTEDIYNNLRRDDFIEVLVSVRFSKLKEFSNRFKEIVELAGVLSNITNQEIIDEKTSDAITGFSHLEKLQSNTEVTCVFNFEDKNFPIIANLDKNSFRCSQEDFTGQAYLLCKVVQKIPKGTSVKIDEIFDQFLNMPLNREQRRNLSKDIKNPDVVRDVIKGPALKVIPIAVYQ